MGFFIPFASFRLASFVYQYNINSQSQATVFEVKNTPIAEALDTRNLDANIIVNGNTERSNNISLLFVGDIMLGRGVENSVIKNGNGDYAFLFKNADFVKNADISFGNLEGPISDTGKDLRNLYSFRFEPLVVEALKNSGFDILSVANNHIGDWGRAAFEDTISRLAANNIAAVGGGQNLSDVKEIRIIEKNGVKIGFLAFSDVGPAWLEATDDSAGILIADDKNFSFLIRQAAPQADVLIVSLHFGEEYQKNANDRQKKLAHLAIGSGAKIVVGHHPHVVQEVEYYKNGVIAYSLGNFIFDQNFSEETMRGLILKVTVEGKKIKSIKTDSVKLNEFFQPQLAD